MHRPCDPALPRYPRPVALPLLAAVCAGVALMACADGPVNPAACSGHPSDPAGCENTDPPADSTSCSESAATGTSSADQWQLVFASDRCPVLGSWAYYRVSADGSDLASFSEHPTSHRRPSVSPDGARITFYSGIGSPGFAIWVMDVDGTGAVRLTNNDGGQCCNTGPRWSPDGSMIAFTTSRESGTGGWEVYVMNADGSDPVNVSNSPTSDFTHGWTPDGKVVMLTDVEGSDPHRMVARVAEPDGSGAEEMLPPGHMYPYWSPDGQRVAVWDRTGEETSVYVMDVDGPEVGRVDGVVLPLESNPWSPDGSRLVVESTPNPEGDIFVVSPDGTGLVELVGGPGRQMFEGWSPDGEMIAYTSDETGDWEVWVASSGGTDRVNVSNHPGEDRYAVWLPRR